MLCPFCQTENRDDQEVCYHCNKDISMLRLIVNKAKHHYNQGLEFAERGQIDDAITEMRNALELDASMVDAHVVLGTLHAKKEQFAEARQCWNDALAIDHCIYKAHQYLDKAELAQYVFPALHRLRMLCFFLVTLFLVTFCLAMLMVQPDAGLHDVHNILFVILLGISTLTTCLAIYMTRPDAGIRDLRQATRLILNASPDLNRARATIEEAERQPAVTPLTGEFARHLRNYIDYEWAERARRRDAQLSQVSDALDLDSPHVAVRLLAALEKESPEESVARTMAQLRTRAVELMNARIDALARGCEAGTTTYETFEREARNFLAIPQPAERVAEINSLVERLRIENDKKMLAQAEIAIREAPTAAEAVSRFADAIARRPAFDISLKAEVQERLEDEAGHLLPRVGTLLEEGQIDAAAAKLDELEQLYRTAQWTSPAAIVEPLRAMIQDRQRQAAVDEAEKSFAGGQWERFLELTANLDALAGDPDERDRLGRMRNEAQDSLAPQAEAQATLEAGVGESVSPTQADATPGPVENAPQPAPQDEKMADGA
jgi:tetratricopeptide (TPR) repeat protein